MKASPYAIGAWLTVMIVFACADAEPITPAPASPQRAPNVVLIVADDLGWHDLACYGIDFIETPNLDRLAASGIRFTNGYAAAAICSPSRATLLSGLHPVETNITEHIHGNGPPAPGQLLRTPPIDQQLQLSYRTTGEMMKAKNYATAYIGKWHLGGGQFQPKFRGFDFTLGAGFNGLPQSFFYPFFAPGQHERLKDVAQEGDYLTDVLTTQALNWVEEHADTSFFLALNYYSPHVPIEGKDVLVEKYRQKRAANPGDTLPDVVYAAMVQSIDVNVGRIMDRLETLGLTENTLIVFTSDNGGLSVREVPAFAAHTPPTDNGPLRAGKGYLYEGGTRVPFVVSFPGRAPGGTVNNTPVIAQDIVEALQNLDAPSIILGTPPSEERLLVWHFPHYSPQGGTPKSALRRGDWKLVYDYETEHGALYNLAVDPGEENDLADAQPQRAAELKALLDGRLRALDAQYPEPI